MHPGVEMDVETLIKASRILNLNDIELYFVEEDDDGPFSPRNELLSLNAVFTSINCAVSDAKPDVKKALREIILKKMDEFSCQYSDNDSIIEYDKDGDDLLEWGNSHGMTAKLKISRRPGTVRGAEASENIGVGDIVLEVPNCLIISEDYVRNSTMLYPHVLPPDSVDSESKSLKFHALRPCNKGEQCYISYGNLSSHDLVKVYGFLPKCPNPCDLIHLDFQQIFEETCARKLYYGKFILTFHMMRGSWLSRSRKLPARLLDDLYAILDVTKGDKSEDSVSIVREALYAIHAHLNNLYARFCSDEGSESDSDRGQVELMFDSDGDEVEVDNSPPRREPEWDVKLANDYKWLMMCIVDAVMSSCMKSLEDWEIKPTCSSYAQLDVFRLL